MDNGTWPEMIAFHPHGHLTKFGTYEFSSRRTVGQRWPDKALYAKSRYSNHP